MGEPIRRGHVARRFARISAHDRIGSTSPRSSRLANGGHVHVHQEAEQETLQHSHPEPTGLKTEERVGDVSLARIEPLARQVEGVFLDAQ